MNPSIASIITSISIPFKTFKCILKKLKSKYNTTFNFINFKKIKQKKNFRNIRDGT